MQLYNWGHLAIDVQCPVRLSFAVLNKGRSLPQGTRRQIQYRYHIQQLSMCLIAPASSAFTHTGFRNDVQVTASHKYLVTLADLLPKSHSHGYSEVLELAMTIYAEHLLPMYADATSINWYSTWLQKPLSWRHGRIASMAKLSNPTIRSVSIACIARVYRNRDAVQL